jgi:hypothetical protein
MVGPGMRLVWVSNFFTAKLLGISPGKWRARDEEEEEERLTN